MGSIIFETGTLIGSLSDVVGTKSGLALDKHAIVHSLGTDNDNRFEEYLDLPDEHWIRVESVVYEEMVERLLYTIGRLEKPHNPPPMGGLYHKHKNDPEALQIVYDLGASFHSLLEETLKDPSLNRGGKLDPSPFMIRATKSYGRIGLEIANDLIMSFAVQLEIKSSHFPSVSEWHDVTQLSDLFRSEGLETQYGKFFDQRYIDYLYRNFERIDDINWRKFEGLTAEYFDRLGFRVDVGPGRNDDGVDVRVWPREEALDAAPAIIVQCKRQKEAISKVIVKSLYADVLHEKATSGLIVTTSRLAPGSQKVCTVRQYPIDTADRQTLQSWIAEMRKLGLGTVT